MDKYEEMLRYADRKYNYSELEKEKIISLLDYCHATDVCMTHRRMYEVFFKCDAMPGKELTTALCSRECARYYGCSNCAAVDDAECLINQEKTIFDFEPSDEFYFKDEVKSILQRYHGNKKDKLSETEIKQITNEVKKELRCLNHLINEGGMNNG